MVKNKIEVRKKIIEYFKKQLKKGIKPTKANIQKKFSISLRTCFPGGMRELYQTAHIPLVGRLRDRKELKGKILNYIRTKVKQGFYPTRAEIEKEFQTNIRGSIRELYKLANVEYKRDPNPFLRYEKEKKLAQITKKLFIKLGYKIKKVSIGPSRPKGADIVIEDNQRRLIPVEIKAFQKFGKIGYTKNSSYFRNEFLQLKKYIKDLHAPYGYLVTSTDGKAFKTLPQDIKIIFGKDIKRLLSQFKMDKELKELEWIRNSSISYGKEKIYRKVREKILKYVKEKWKEGKYVSKREILRKFRVNPESYFPGGSKEIYKKLGLDPEIIPNYRMSRNFDREKFKEKIITFVKEEIKRGRFPTYKEIQSRFHCLVKLYFPGGIREIAKLIGIRYNRKFAAKTSQEKELIKQKIIDYVKKKLQKGYYPTYRDFRKDLLVGPLNYFDSIESIYRRAGWTGLVKKTWKNFGKRSEFKIKN